MKFLRLPSGTVINLDNVTTIHEVSKGFGPNPDAAIALNVAFVGGQVIPVKGADMGALTEWFSNAYMTTEGYYVAECSDNDAEAFAEPYNERDADLYRHAEQMNRNPEALPE